MRATTRCIQCRRSIQIADGMPDGLIYRCWRCRGWDDGGAGVRRIRGIMIVNRRYRRLLVALDEDFSPVYLSPATTRKQGT